MLPCASIDTSQYGCSVSRWFKSTSDPCNRPQVDEIVTLVTCTVATVVSDGRTTIIDMALVNVFPRVINFVLNN